MQPSIIKPCIKIPGGKTQLLKILLAHQPQTYATYYEVFLGGASLALAVQAPKAVLGDLNPELINCYLTIKQQPAKLIEKVEAHKANDSKEYYYKIRKLDRQINFANLSSLDRAARFIYLNKTCYSGIIRYNKSGCFNTPYANYKQPKIIEESNIYQISNYLNENKVQLKQGDFASTLKNARKNSFIYLDPPYAPLSSQSQNFTQYSKEGFNEQSHIRLKSLCDSLSDRGIKILISNSNCEFIRGLYKDPRYQIIEVTANRAINSKIDKRQGIKELLIYNNYQK